MSFQKKNKTCNITRLTRSGIADAYNPTPVYNNISMGIFPASNSILAVYPGELSFQLYEIFIYDFVELNNGDKFTDVNNGDEWILRGVPRPFDLNRGFALQCIGEKVIGS